MTITLCGACGEEIRRGLRHGRTDWWHREDVDHAAVLGQPFTSELAAQVGIELDVVRLRLAKGVAAKCPTYQRFWPLEEYTTREHDRAKMKKSIRDALDDEDDIVVELPPVEIPCHPVDVSTFAPRSGIRQVCNLVAKQGWELVRLTHARGPYVGASGACLSISDTIVLAARKVRVDGSTNVAVGSWRDGKFDFAFTGTIQNGNLSTTKADATQMKNWIKGTE